MKCSVKRIFPLLLCLALLVGGLGGCTGGSLTPATGQYTATFLSLFDTVTTVVGVAESREDFEAMAADIRDGLDRYHKLFDIYHTYEGMSNLKTVNDMAAVAPVIVDAAILDLLADCKAYYEVTGGVFNPAMGSVLRLWHDAREDGLNDPASAYLPDADALKAAAAHMDPADIVLDRAASTVYLADPELKLDVGGIAKGWATRRVCEEAPEGLLVSVGGNVCATGPKGADGTPWRVGIQDPAESTRYLYTLSITGGSVVTSGSYQRAYAVGGKAYHHIIDPRTLFPGERWVSVTVVTDDSGLADVLSTALFLLPREEGQALLDRYGAHALWVDAAGEQYFSPGFRELIHT